MGIGKLIAWATVVLTLLGLAWYGVHIWRRETADTKGQTDVVEQISGDADYRIAAYEEFYDRCWAVIELEAQIQLAEEAVEAESTDWGREEAERNLLALQNTRIDLITSYNSAASKTDTAQNFLASDLPRELNLEGETSCTATE